MILVIKLPLPIVILASGNGTNARVLMDYAEENPEKAQVVALISDRSGVPALELAKEFGVQTYVVDYRNESTLLTLLQSKKPSWAFLAGYKRKVGKGFLEFFWDESLGFSRIMNVHPSLLPAFPGLLAYEQAFHAGVKISGVTVHLVDSGIDTGKAILQESFIRDDNDTLESFEKKGKKLEHKLFLSALKLAIAERIQMIHSPGGISYISTNG